MTKTDHLNRPILKLNSFKNNPDRPLDVEDTSSLAKNNKIDTACGDHLNEGIKSEPKNNDKVQAIKKTILKPTKQKKILLTEEEYQEVLAYMQKHFPNTFPYNLDPVPLAVGIGLSAG
jgi:hypothetical protein